MSSRPTAAAVAPPRFVAGSKLHVGCGSRRLLGWINADTAPGVGDVMLDLHDIAALPTSTFLEIYGSHVLEHCWPQDTPGILKRMRAALVPGGTVRLSVPDLRLVVKNCVDSSAFGDETTALSVIYGGDFSKTTSSPDLHRQAFWKERLVKMLTEAGFVNVREWGRGQYPEIDALADYSTFPCDASGKSSISLNLEADRAGERPRAKAAGATVNVSVILGTVNRTEMLRDCVASIRKDLAGTSYEIVIAYGREDDKSLPWMRAQADIVPILGGMDGAIAAFNRAYAAARGRLICQINDDVTIDGTSITRAVKHLDETPSSAGVVFKFDRGDGRGYRHEYVAGALHPNQMVVRRETCETIIERIGGFWGDAEHRTDRTYGGDSAFGVMCKHLGLRLDSVDGVTCRDLLAADALREHNKVSVASDHSARWQAMYTPLTERAAPPPAADEWPNLYIPRAGMPPRRSPVAAGRPLRLLHLSLQVLTEPQVDMRRAFAQMGPTMEVPWELVKSARGEEAAHREMLAAARAHKPDVVWAQVHGPWSAHFQVALRDAVGPDCTLIQWTGDVRTSDAQPVDRWLVDFGAHFDILLADGCTYPRKLKIDERVLAACGYLACGIDPGLNPWRPNESESGGATFFGSHYPTIHFGKNDRTEIFEEVQRLAPGKLTIYGTGWGNTRLAAIWKQFVPQEQASVLMRRSPLTIATSIYNDMPRYTSDRLKRAMASGSVVAVRRFPDMEGLGLRDGENSLFWSTPAELAKLIQEWTVPEKRPQRDAIRANAAALAHERFTWDRVTEELLAIIRDYRSRRGLT